MVALTDMKTTGELIKLVDRSSLSLKFFQSNNFNIEEKPDPVYLKLTQSRLHMLVENYV